MPNTTLHLIHKTAAVSVWNPSTGPIFWYAAGVPGPFYINTEWMIGRDLAERLLKEITTILATTNDPAKRVEALNTCIMEAYNATPDYQAVIHALAEQTAHDFAEESYDVISGGERRDWLFSIPLAAKLGVPHLYLFKNQTYYCPTEMPENKRVLHVADLINNAASYFDLWFPILNKAGMNFIGTSVVNVRGENGLNRLKEVQAKVSALHYINLDFFKSWQKAGLISEERVEELALFFQSSAEWGRTYITQSVELFDIPHLDKKSLERLKGFIQQDPWGLKKTHPDFLHALKKSIP